MAILQAKEIDRDVYLMPPKDVRKEGYISKLKVGYWKSIIIILNIMYHKSQTSLKSRC